MHGFPSWLVWLVEYWPVTLTVILVAIVGLIITVGFLAKNYGSGD